MAAYRYRIATYAERPYPRLRFVRYESRTILSFVLGRYAYCLARVRRAPISSLQPPMEDS